MTTAGCVLDLMHASPLVALKGRQCARPRARLWAKLELALPGQMKDRVAAKMVEDAEARGLLRPGGLIVESSSGTLAEGLARVAAVKGYRLVIVTDPRLDEMSAAKLRAFGARLDVVSVYHPVGGWQYSRLERVKQILDEEPGAFWPRQYDTPSNAGAYAALAAELTAALGDRLAAVIGTVGSGGSLSGTVTCLRKRVGSVRAIAVDAVGSVQFHQPNRARLQSGHGNSIIPGNICYASIDEVHWISDGEAFAACRELASREGIFAGGSSGAAYIVGSWVAERFDPHEHVVVIFPDRGDRYASTIYSDAYLATHGLAGVEAAAQPARVTYGEAVVERWSYADLPHDGSRPYYAADAVQSAALARQLGVSD